MRTRKNLSISILLVLAICLVACSVTIGSNSSKSEQSSKSDFEGKTEVTTGEMEIRTGMIVNTVTIKKMVLQTGSITLTLYRPNGEVFLTKAFTAPVDTSDIIKMDMDTGVWKMKMEYKDATGNFFIKWNAHN
jgi:hypothetical protein